MRSTKRQAYGGNAAASLTVRKTHNIAAVANANAGTDADAYAYVYEPIDQYAYATNGAATAVLSPQ